MTGGFVIGSLANFFHRLASNCNPPDHPLSSNGEFRCEPLHLVILYKLEAKTIFLLFRIATHGVLL
jgi:hypothetical protein